MIGKASEIHVVETSEVPEIGQSLETSIHLELDDLGEFEILDIKYAVNTDPDGKVVSSALIIYKEGESS